MTTPSGTAAPRVACLTTAREVIGGAEEGLLGILRHYPRDVAAPTLVAPPGGEMEVEARALDLPFLAWDPPRLPLGMRPGKLLPFWRGLRRGSGALEAAAREQGFALITTHSIEAHLFGARLGRRTGIPVLWHIRDVHRAAGERWALRLVGTRGRPGAVFLSEAARRGFPAGIPLLRRDHPDTPPDAILGDGLDLERFDDDATSPTGTGTDRERLDPAALRDSLRLASDAFVVAYVGQLLPRKGLTTLLDALDLLVQEKPREASRLRVLIVGDGPKRRAAGYRPALEARAAGAVWRDRVTFLGRRRDVPALLRAVDALVLPSRHEALGLVVLEAMARGKPVIGCADAGIAEPVRHEVEGLLVPAGDPRALATALARLLADPALAQRLGNAGEERVRACYDARVQAGRHARYHRTWVDGAGA